MHIGQRILIETNRTLIVFGKNFQATGYKIANNQIVK